jgi:erythromycin esterase-like protein
MKVLCSFLLATLLSFSGFCQSQSIIQNFSVYPLRSIQSTDVDFSDLELLKDILTDKRIVLLGEQSHGDGASFEAKVRLVKFLHQEMGFDMISFESDLLDAHRAWQEIKTKDYKESPLRESIYYIWSETKELDSFIKYVHEQAATEKPLMVTGFDCQGSVLLEEGLLNEIGKEIGNSLILTADETASIEQVQQAGAEFLAENEADSALFFAAINKVRASLKKSIAADSTELKSILRQSLEGWVEMIRWQIDHLHERDVKVQNPRDRQMAFNLIYLSKLYPDKKIIAWGASYHFANQIELLENTPLVELFSKRMDSIQHTHETTNVVESLEGSLPMGRILKKQFGETLYSLAFSSYEGKFGMVGHEPMSLEKIPPPEGSIEVELVKNNLPMAIVNFNKTKNQKFYSSALGNLPLFAPWQHIFDGLFFIKTSYPPSFVGNAHASTEEETATKRQSDYANTGSARLINAVSKEGISYANISLKNTTKGVTTNAAGEFAFNVPEAKPGDLVILSSIGYETDTISVQELTSHKEFALMPKTYQLDEIEVRAKPLSAKEIIKMAERRIPENYFQGAHQQEFFYRVSEYKEDSLLSNEEAAVLVYDADGYRPSNHVSKSLKGQILQFRNTTHNSDRDLWAGVGSLWLMYTHDTVMEKDNMLHRSNYYNFTLLGIVVFENKRVYELAFECKRPGAYTTGFGYPAPASASGKIYIEVGTYAVLRVETLIYRQPHHAKKKPHIIKQPHGHQLIQTYKEVDGKYFLNYSRQVHFGKWTDTKEKWSYRGVSVREQLSTEVNLNPQIPLARSLMSIKAAPVKEDADFWNRHNMVIKDDVAELHKLIKEIN